MSSPSLTLQCHQCSGIFSAPKVDFSSLVKCPHCAIAAPVGDFSALTETSGGAAPVEQGDSVSPNPPLGEPPAASPAPHPAPAPAPSQPEGDYVVRGKWLQFDCPHCVRPMRLVVEDAGGLVDCAHCGLELVAPDPAVGRGARLSRASEGRVGSISRFNMRDMRHGKIEQRKSEEQAAEESQSVENWQDPGHSAARSGGAGGGATSDYQPRPTPAEPEPVEPPPPRQSAVKAIETGQLGRSFQRRDEALEEGGGFGNPNWDKGPEGRPAFGESREDKRGFWIAAASAALVMAGIVFMAVREASKPNKEVFDSTELAAIKSVRDEAATRHQAVFDDARAALASEKWEDLLAHVRDSDRVAPLMRQYYAERDYKPIQLTGFNTPLEIETGGVQLTEMRVEEEGGGTRKVVLEGDKLDWELFANYPLFSWHQFLEDGASSSRDVSAIVSRSSLLERYFADAGLQRDDAIGLRVWNGENADGYKAVVARDSELGRQLQEVLVWDVGRKLVVRASFDPESELDDRLRIDAFLKTGWVNGTLAAEPAS